MSARLVVIGDTLLDVDLLGRAARLSPDAPVPVVDELAERFRPGGAALAALLAARAGGEVTLVTPLTDDDAAVRVRSLLAGWVRLEPLPATGSTPVKTRVRASGQSLVRLDRGTGATSVGVLPGAVGTALAGADALLVADYGYGATGTGAVRRAIMDFRRSRPVVWDPHPRGAAPVPGVHLVTPNAQEAADWVAAASRTGQRAGPGRGGGAGGGRWAVPARHATQLVAEWNVGAVAITLGPDGALLSYGPGAPVVLPAAPLISADPCGAGDMFAATAALELAAGSVTAEAAQRAVVAASAFVGAGGAAALRLDRRAAALAALSGNGRGSVDRAAAVVERVRAGHGVVVAAGGCFDLLHAGHVEYLQAARRLGDALVVCLNSDASVRRLKGPGRPLVSAEHRARVLAALDCVDAVEVFDEDTPVEVLRRLRPDVWAKGGDYAGAQLPEQAVLAVWGGQVVTLPYVTGHSTSALVDAVTRSAGRG